MGDLRVTVNGLDFYGDRGPFLIEPGGFTGWDEGVSVRSENVSRPGAHGAYDMPVFLDSRTPSLSGNVLADSPAQLATLRKRLTGLLAAGQLGRIQVARPWGTEWADCRLAGQTKFLERGGTSTASFQLQLWCPNPRKYGDTNTFTFTGTGELFQYGNFQASPVFTISGDAPLGYTINGEHGEEYKVTTPLVPGAPHTINFANARLRIGSTLTSNGNGAADVWDTAAGSVSRYILSSAGTVSATATVTDTFI